MSESWRLWLGRSPGIDRRRLIPVAGIVAGLAIIVASSTNSAVRPDADAVSRIVSFDDPGLSVTGD